MSLLNTEYTPKIILVTIAANIYLVLLVSKRLWNTLYELTQSLQQSYGIGTNSTYILKKREKNKK